MDQEGNIKKEIIDNRGDNGINKKNGETQKTINTRDDIRQARARLAGICKQRNTGLLNDDHEIVMFVPKDKAKEWNH